MKVMKFEEVNVCSNRNFKLKIKVPFNLAKFVNLLNSAINKFPNCYI